MTTPNMSADTRSDIDEFYKNNYSPRMREILEEVVNKTVKECGGSVSFKHFKDDEK